MKNRQFEHIVWFHPKVLNQTWSTDKLSIQGYSMQVLNHTWNTDKLNIQGGPIQKCWARHEVLISWTYRLMPSKSFELDMKNRQFEYTGWFNPKFWTRHEVLTTWTYRVIPSKSFEPDMKYWQIEHTGWFNPSFEPDMKYWQIEHTGWFYPSFEPDMKYWQIEHTGRFNAKVLNHTWRRNKLNIQGDSIQKLCTRYEVLTSWTYRMIQYKSFELGMKYWQIKHTGWFNPKLLNQTWSRQVEHTAWFHPKVLNQIWSTNKLNIQDDSIQKLRTRHEVLTN
jgi:hypothetical protein